MPLSAWDLEECLNLMLLLHSSKLTPNPQERSAMLSDALPAWHAEDQSTFYGDRVALNGIADTQIQELSGT